MEPAIRKRRPDGKITSRYVRYKMWRLHSAVVREVCQTNGMEFVPVPEASMDAEGFLRPECYATDAAHANEEYARHLLHQIDGIVGRQQADMKDTR